MYNGPLQLYSTNEIYNGIKKNVLLNNNDYLFLVYILSL